MRKRRHDRVVENSASAAHRHLRWASVAANAVLGTVVRAADRFFVVSSQKSDEAILAPSISPRVPDVIVLCAIIFAIAHQEDCMIYRGITISENARGVAAPARCGDSDTNWSFHKR